MFDLGTSCGLLYFHRPISIVVKCKVLRNVRSELARKLADPPACSVSFRYNIVSLVVSSKPLNKRFCWIDESQALDLMKGKFRKLGSLIYVDFYSS